MHTELVEYRDGDTVLEGFLAYDDTVAGKRPAVLVAPAWAGRDDFTCDQARRLAGLGYVGFALDMYGKGVLGTSNDENTALMMPFLEDRRRLRRRVTAALDVLADQEPVEVGRIGAMGYCFGGLCVLDLARSGADVRGVVSFHGIFSPPADLPNEQIRAKVLALHGHDDPMVPPEQVAGLQQELTEAGVDWQIHVYGNTVHAFTNPEANDPGFGTVYDAAADRRSGRAMGDFFAEVFA